MYTFRPTYCTFISKFVNLDADPDPSLSIYLNFPFFFFLFQKQNPALSLKHYFHVLDVNVEVSIAGFSAILIAFWMPTIMKNIFDVAVYQKFHHG